LFEITEAVSYPKLPCEVKLIEENEAKEDFLLVSIEVLFHYPIVISYRNV
jgi:hypothetical protein